MKRSIDERGPIAAWLIRSRAQFREPNAQRAWTVDDFLTALKADTGWAPVRTTYARWESGATRPEPENLRRVEAFYAARGIGPEAPPEPAGATESPETVASAIQALVVELRLWRTEDRAKIAEIDATVKRLVGRTRAAPRTPKPRAPRAPRETAG